MANYFTIRWENGRVVMIDQRLLPHTIRYNEYDTVDGIAEAIRTMVIRGAPAIGVAAAYGLALSAQQSPAKNQAGLIRDMRAAGEVLLAARPTAVNLAWAVDRILNRAARAEINSVEQLRVDIKAWADDLAKEDGETNRRMGEYGLSVVPQGAQIIHHCNTGTLATVDFGTALGVIRAAHESGRNVFVYVDETRPRLQGARLTAWELQQLGIPFAVITDSASGYFMRQGKVDLCLVGCDRVAANGDTANKIGTYNLALVAKAHHVPFYVVGPTSTIDIETKNGDDIPIEERSTDEVTHIGTAHITPDGAGAVNPAFDITPAHLISGIITEKGIVYPPYLKNLSKFFGSSPD
jgi:methylthioribose-1-phosphate isomerase